ncbi:hypothetical protein HZI73_17515 [Vallitalea pronyensis]|uniref:Uncharacterized protein n=1 Tax=Vallitalea pronyensis TaxID=1348613 RepID=A0A8J8SI07_9FIRM|nr:hypothetical protein [Vallitalea pronyensis]QUI23983.1 hypothetical protein HZI73_17515 [Vallitalea pronyensis]
MGNKEDAIMVVCATLNQVVNYIGLEHYMDRYTIKQIYMITEMASETSQNKVYKFDHATWNKNFKNEVKKIHKGTIEKIGINQSNSIESVIDSIERELQDVDEHTTILWNMTGGQRHVIFACEKYIENRLGVLHHATIEGQNDRNHKNIEHKQCGRTHIRFYLEGNYTRLYENNNYMKWESRPYQSALTLEQVLGLAGFKTRENNPRKNILLEEGWNDAGLPSIDMIQALVKDYIKPQNKQLRQELIQSLRKDKSKVASNINDLKLFEYKDDVNQRQKKKNFGHLLEYMTLYCIYEYIMANNIAHFVDLRHSLNVNRYGSNEKTNNRNDYCEFDIILMTKSRKLFIFECKAGSMPSSTGKGRQMTVYATSGVYGTPILVTPLLSQETDMLDVSSSTKNELDKDTYKYVAETTRAAKRIGLDIWFLDKIEENMDELIKDIGKGDES